MDAEGNGTAVTQVKKGRRGLAKKKSNINAVVVGQETASTSHVVSVYSSCVSRGYKGLMGGNDPLIKSSVIDGAVVKDVSCDVKPTENTSDKLHPATEDEVIVEEKEKLSNAADDSILIDDEFEYVEGPKGVESLRSPTPPPITADTTHLRKRKMNRQLTSALNTLNRAKGSLKLTPSTSFTKSRRKKKGQNAQVNQFTYLDYTPEKTDMHIKVRYLSNIHRIFFKLTDPFLKLLRDLSGEIGQEERHLGLFLNDQALPLFKTPKDIGLTVADIIECHCVKDSKSDSTNETLSLLIQCYNSKRKTKVTVTKRQCFKDILDVYAQQVGIDVSSFAFCFDGDHVDPEDVPLTLEMDDGDVLDLVPSLTDSARQEISTQNSVITIL